MQAYRFARSQVKIPPMINHPALAALDRVRDHSLMCMGYDKAKIMGQLSAYLRYMNKSPNGGYSMRKIVSAKTHHLGFPYDIPRSADRARRLWIDQRNVM